jgi:hypothetical protein
VPLVALVLAVAIPVAVWAALQQLKVSAGWKAAGAALAVAAPLLVAEGRETRKRDMEYRSLLAKHLRLWSQQSGGLLIRDISDPIALGVKPAAGSPHAHAHNLPTYVPRDADVHLDDALATSNFVLLIGDSAAGKSRTAFEAMRRRFPDRVLIVPARPESLATLLNQGLEFRHGVVWLDDIDSYLGVDTLSLTDLERLFGDGDRAVTVLATIRKAAYERYDENAALHERKLLRAAATIPLDRKLTTAESRLAEQLSLRKMSAFERLPSDLINTVWENTWLLDPN